VEAELGISLQAMSVPDAVVYAGPSYFMALERRHGRSVLVDCGDRAGDVLACLRTGLRTLMFRGNPEVAERLRSIADQHAASLASCLAVPLIEVGEDDDLARSCRRHVDAAPAANTSV
jgi:hypothetical protein